jgi:hypothetical protein
VLDPGAQADARLLPFTTQAAAQTWSAAHPGSSLVSYQQALGDA